MVAPWGTLPLKPGVRGSQGQPGTSAAYNQEHTSGSAEQRQPS